MVDDSYLKDFRYYSRIVMFIICSIQFILFIVYIAVIYDVKDTINENPRISYFYCNNIFHYFSQDIDELCDDFKSIMREQGQGIAATFSFFIISYVIFFIECIIHFCCNNNNNNNNYNNNNYGNNLFDNICKDGNHFITLLTFIIAQFMYLIACLIIPIYLDRVRTIRDMFSKSFGKDMNEILGPCVNKYGALLAVAFTFLIIFIFLYFIIMNLYRDVCCDMTEICTRTESCLKEFFRCYYLQIRYIFTGCQRDDGLDNELKELEGKVNKTVIEIKNLMAENLKLRCENINNL